MDARIRHRFNARRLESVIDTRDITIEAIVLRREDRGEADRRLTLLDRTGAKHFATAKGARKPGSRLAGASEPLVHAVFHVAAGRRAGIVTQVQPLTSYPGLRSDYERLSFGMALLEWVDAVVQAGQTDPAVFECLDRGLRAVEGHAAPLVAYLWSMSRLMECEGVLPSWHRCVATGSPVTEDPAFVTLEGGGYVCLEASADFVDRTPVGAEILLGLAKTAELDSPPPRLRHDSACLRLLLRFARAAAHRDLPASDALVALIGP